MTRTLTWQHHTLIQALLSRGPLKKNEFYSILAQVLGKSPDQRVFNQYLLDINEKLAYVQFELRACRNQYDENVYYGVVNNVADEQSKLGTKYSASQVAYYKGIIEAIVQDTAGQGSISNTSALNIRPENQIASGTESQPHGSQGYSSQIPTSFKNFTMTQKDKTIEEFVRDQWLSSTSDGQIGLGIRSFLDLRSWFHNNEVPICEICNEAAVKAEACQNEGCNVRLHLYCLEKKFSQRKVARVCPGCKTQWHHLPEVETVEEEDEESNAPSQNLNHSSRKRKATSQVEAVEEEKGDISAPHQNLRHSSRKKKKGTPHSCISEEAAASSVHSTLPDVKRVTRNSSRMASSNNIR